MSLQQMYDGQNESINIRTTATRARRDLFFTSYIPQDTCTSLKDNRTPPCGLIKQPLTAKWEGQVCIYYVVFLALQPNVVVFSQSSSGF